MKFKTQHIKVAAGRDSYGLHRDGYTTWETTENGVNINIRNIIKHKTVAAAKALLGSISSQSKH